METTDRLVLPMILPGQAQKETVHNEALLRLDTVVAAAVEQDPSNEPPQSPSNGSCYIVGVEPTGDWSGYANHLASFTIAGWRFIAPITGLSVLVKPSGLIASYAAGGWETGIVRAAELQIQGQRVVSAQAPAIADPAGGANMDAEARSAVAQILSALRAHGLIAAS